MCCSDLSRQLFRWRAAAPSQSQPPTPPHPSPSYMHHVHTHDCDTFFFYNCGIVSNIQNVYNNYPTTDNKVNKWSFDSINTRSLMKTAEYTVRQPAAGWALRVRPLRNIQWLSGGRKRRDTQFIYRKSSTPPPPRRTNSVCVWGVHSAAGHNENLSSASKNRFDVGESSTLWCLWEASWRFLSFVIEKTKTTNEKKKKNCLDTNFCDLIPDWTDVNFKVVLVSLLKLSGYKVWYHTLVAKGGIAIQETSLLA